MKLGSITFFILCLFVSFQQAYATDFILVGKVPGQYLGKSKEKSYLASISIAGKVIEKIETLSLAQLRKLESEGPAGAKLILLQSAQGQSFDTIYPGLIDLHNHAKQNMLPVWAGAKGQFSNRYEWRSYVPYKEAVSSNTNPWLQAEKALSCAAYRWNELQSLTLGTTYLQGHRDCDLDFTIQRVEDPEVYNSDLDSLSTPVDLFVANNMVYIWKAIKPEVDRGVSLEKALLDGLQKECSQDTDIASWSEKDILEKADVLEKNFASKDWLKNSCAISEAQMPKGRYPCSVNNEDWYDEGIRASMVRYFQCGHPTIARYKLKLQQPKFSSFIFHLAEGRWDDPYNKIEFEIVKTLGFDQAHVGMVHATSLSAQDYAHVIDRQMGIIWSPFSNLLLYGQTMDLTRLIEGKKLAKTKNELIFAIGSDWTPTGSKSVLEELKIARKYLKKTGQFQSFGDDFLYDSVTSGPARLIQAEEKIGTLKEGAMASLLITKSLSKNPLENLVALVGAEEVNLVFVDGQPIYGNQSYIAPVVTTDFETLPTYVGELSDWVSPQGVAKFADLPAPPSGFSRFGGDEEKWQYNMELGHWIQSHRQIFGKINNCKKISSEDPKVLVHQESGDEIVETFKSTGLNIDRAYDIQMLLATAVLTQNKNVQSPGEAWTNLDSRLKYFPSLFTCNDAQTTARLQNFISEGPEETDEFTENLKFANEFDQTAQQICQAYGVCKAQ
ncbi:MAG: amidohydrolase family protein [Bdellovibrionales bacterium]|nr:amidohydrolase family protein [Bdellovibrionales bacterium]